MPYRLCIVFIYVLWQRSAFPKGLQNSIFPSCDSFFHMPPFREAVSCRWQLLLLTRFPLSQRSTPPPVAAALSALWAGGLLFARGPSRSPPFLARAAALVGKSPLCLVLLRPVPQGLKDKGIDRYPHSGSFCFQFVKHAGRHPKRKPHHIIFCHIFDVTS